MGTRNVTIVRFGGETRLSQYCQWDGYPSGQGKTLYDFISEDKLERLKCQLHRVVSLSVEDRQKAEADFYSSIGSKGYVDGFVAYDDYGKFMKAIPSLGRDIGAKLLDHILDTSGPVLHFKEELDFDHIPSWLEYVWVLNLDNSTLTMHGSYKVVTLRFDQWPTYEEFLKLCEYDES